MNPLELPDTTDVVILGAGLAGHCAALAAAEAGAEVVLLEKAPTPGGSTVMSAGSFAFAGTRQQREAGVEDSPAALADELIKVSGGYADRALVDLYVSRQADTYEWLQQQGVQFHQVSLSSSTAVPRTHPTHARQLIDCLHARAWANPRIRYVCAVAGRKLLTTPEGRVTGVELEVSGRQRQLKCTGGVVIATGGFTRNPGLIRRFAPELAAAPAWGGGANSGDGLMMAWALGADLLDMGFVAGTFGVAINHYPDTDVRPGDELMLRMAMYRGGIAVNLRAERFADESQSYKKLATLCLAQPKAVAFQIFDQRVMDQSAPNPSVNDLQGALEKGVVKRAATLPELGRILGIDGEKLQATVERYNAGVAAGVDSDFGRAALAGSFGKPVRIDASPFYALPCSAALLSTYAGLRVDPDMRVLKVSGEPIEGLYAAGEVVGGFHGAGYMSGSSLGKAAIFGRVAGGLAASRASPRPEATPVRSPSSLVTHTL